jgi:hypothetical protein
MLIAGKRMLDTHHLRDELDVAQISRSAVRPAVSVRNGQDGRAGATTGRLCDFYWCGR